MSDWQLVGDGTPLNAWLETRREDESGTNLCFCRIMCIGEEPEWVARDGRTTVTHHSFAAPTHWRWPSSPPPEVPVGGGEVKEKP